MRAVTFYAVVKSEILPLARTITSKEQFQKLKTTLLTRAHGQGSQNTQVKGILNELFGKHFESFKRFADTLKARSKV